MKKIISLALAFMMLAVMLVSCSGDPAKTGVVPTGTGSTNATGTVATTGEIAREDMKDGLPDDLDYNGSVVRVYVRDGDKNLKVEEKTEEIVNDAVYERQLRVQDRLNIEIEIVNGPLSQSELANSLRNIIRSNAEQCDVTATPRYYQMALAHEGFYEKLNNYDQYLDFSQPWWSQGFIEAATIGDGNVYFAAGDASCNFLMSARGLAVNTTIFDEKIGDSDELLFDLILDGKWTLDKLVEYSKTVYEDINGDGNKDESDLYGLGLAPNASMIDYYIGLGVQLSERDSEGLPVLILGNEKNAEISEKTLELMYQTEGVWVKGASQADSDFITEKFKKGEMMFQWCQFSHLKSFREMSTDFAMIPYPKYEESQDNYRTYAADSGTIFGIPTCAQDPELSAIFLEAMASDGYKFVTPEVYSNALQKAWAREDKHGAMLDLISSTVYFDFVNLHSASIGGIEYMLPTNVWTSPDGNFVSTWDKNKDAYQQALEDVIDAYKNIF